MAPAYENKTTGKVIVSDEPRPDLDALARWHQISEEDAEAILAAAAERAEEETTVDDAEDADVAKLVAFIKERDLTAADVLGMLTAEPPAQPPAEDAASTPAVDGANTPPASDGSASDNSAAPAAAKDDEPAPAKSPRGRGKKAADA